MKNASPAAASASSARVSRRTTGPDVVLAMPAAAAARARAMTPEATWVPVPLIRLAPSTASSTVPVTHVREPLARSDTGAQEGQQDHAGLGGGAQPAHRTVLSALAAATARRTAAALLTGLLVLGAGLGVGDDAAPGLHVRHAVAMTRGADRDGHVEVAGEVEVADDAAVQAAAGSAPARSMICHRPGLRRTGQRARGEGRGEHVEGASRPSRSSPTTVETMCITWL